MIRGFVLRVFNLTQNISNALRKQQFFLNLHIGIYLEIYDGRKKGKDKRVLLLRKGKENEKKGSKYMWKRLGERERGDSGKRRIK